MTGDNMTPKELKAVEDRIRREEGIVAAADSQRRMLPDPPTLEGYELEVLYEPARLISRDFYDFVAVSRDAWGIVLGRASGSGAEAGMLVAMTKAVVSVYARQAEGPVEALCLANDELCRGLAPDSFVSVNYAVLDAGSGKLRYARAGGMKPVMVNPAWLEPEPRTIEAKGLALGITRGPRFRRILEEVELVLEPGDTFFQYTDGLVETTNSKKERFGQRRVTDVLGGFMRSPAAEIVEMAAVRLGGFTRGKGNRDDVTIVALKARDLARGRAVSSERS
jgi:sigma-B regulation protein RsbU (phosphoserine phosphatase)